MTNQTTKKLIVLGSIIFSFLFAGTNVFADSCTGYSCLGYRYSPYNPANQDYQNYQNNTSTQYDYYYQQVVPVPYVPSYVSTNTNTKTNPTVVNNYYYQDETARKNTTTVNEENNSYISTDNNSLMNRGQQIEEDYYRNNLGASAYNSYDQSEGNKITALSLRGSGGFMPTSIWQWILVVILILAIIVIARMFVRKPHPTDYDTHPAPAH